MSSLFPGMNPYLEQSYDWEEFHHNFISQMQIYLAGRVGTNYLVKAEVRLILHERYATERRFVGRADVGLELLRDQSAAVATETLAAPYQLKLPAIDVEKQHYLEIRDMRQRRLITVIELLSPSNKASGDDRNAYLGKRAEVLTGQAHLVEVDLRRGGKRPSPPQLPPCDYYALVSRHETRPDVDYWPFGLRDPLPMLPVPLAAPGPAIPLDLKAILDTTYDACAYANHIYLESPEPLLSPDDMAWARGIAGIPI